MVTFMMVVVVLPVAVVGGLLAVAGRLQRARETRIARQVAVTDAIHRELGAVVAPVVARRLGRGWRAEIAVPLESPAIVGPVVAIVQATLGPAVREIVLTAQEPPVRRVDVRSLQPAAMERLQTSYRRV
jgi:hypothetical protein